MEISHIIRGQEFLASTPNYLNIYEALELTPQVMATMPHILGPDGKKKLSKRDGAKDVLDYVREGYLPEALINFIASLGWNDGTTQEVFTMEELISKFRLSRVQKSGARFDEQRLKWLNGAHIRNLEAQDLDKLAEGFWPSEASSFDAAYRHDVLALVQERLKYLGELPELTMFFFKDLPFNPELVSSNKQLSKLDKNELKSLLEGAVAAFQDSSFEIEDLSARLNNLLEETGQKPGVLFSLIRIATTQAPASPALAETMHVLGKERSIARIQSTIQNL
jgi:glutamyl-tRNA synthetase